MWNASVPHQVQDRSGPAPASTGVCLGVSVPWPKNVDRAQYLLQMLGLLGRQGCPKDALPESPPLSTSTGRTPPPLELWPTRGFARHLLDVCPSH